PASNRATDVRDALSAACRAAGVEMRFETAVTDLVPEGAGWRLTLQPGEAVLADRVVLATGGLSVPNTGSDGFGLRVAERLSHPLVPTYPALAPLTSVPEGGGPAPHAGLSGVSLAARVRVPGAKGPAPEPRGFLFTHRGYSGPSVLDVSHVSTLARAAGRTQPVEVQWADLDADAWDALLRTPGPGTVASAVRAHVPARLAEALLEHAGIPPDRTRGDLRRDERRRLVTALAAFPLPVTGDEGYRKAEVTGGGVALSDVDAGTLESRRAPGLHVCGELLDAFGPIGGYNFLWAWATGRLAGLGAAKLNAS
ncbi:MAG TPA: aminoacetone oxidase family FAD-binding enzyme, partial [Rubricoccaceae bacterium]